MGPRRIYLSIRRCGAVVARVSLRTKLKQVWVATFVFAISLLFAGCGTGMTVVALMSPSISQVSPQVVTVGTPSVTVTVQGANFQSQAALTVDGNAVPTTVVNSTTIAANISGTTLAQPAVAQLQVRNSDGASSNQVPLTVTTAPDSGTALSIATTQLPSAQMGVSYRVSLAAAGGTQPYKWSVSSGSLPSGLTMSNGGVISGTPSVSGTFSFAVTVTDSKAQSKTVTFSIVVAPVKSAPTALSISSAALSAGQVGSTYAVSLNVSGGTPGYTWSLASGRLPAGLALSSAGVISGTPTTSGTSTFAVAVKDSSSPTQTASASESITVNAAAPSKLTIATTSLAAGKNGSSYSAPLSVSGGTPGYTWSLASGSLPAGLSLSGAGVISGTPTASGTSTFTVAVKDSGSPAQTASVQESITVSTAPATLTITSTSLGAAKKGSSYSATLSATGGTPGYTWSISSGSLPAGLTMSSGGVISGTPTANGTTTFTIAAKDSGSPAQTASAQESITVSVAASTLTVTSTSLGAAQTGSSYSTTLSANGGTPGYTWSVSAGILPDGLTMSNAGVISGTPTGAGTSNFTVTVTDSSSPAETASAQESIAVSATQLAITTISLGYGTSGSGYSAILNASGGTPSYTWSISSGSLPPGLTLSSAGVISGTPTASGTSTFTVSVADSESPVKTATQQESITVTTYNSTGGGAQIYVYPQAPVAPRGSYQTVTAVVTGVNDKTVTWSSDGGTIVGTNPCVVNEPCTVALYTTTPGTYHLTAKSNANSSVIAGSTITITASPMPVTSHPRLGGITAAMLPALRSKAVQSNPLYATLYNNAVTVYNNDNAIWTWSCNGGSGQPNSDQTENYKEGDAYLFAFMSMIDPNDSTYNWGCYGRDIWMYYANFWLNPLSSSYTPATLAIRQVDSNYGLTGNHGSDSTEALTLTPDWLMAGGYLSAADQQVTRSYFALAGQQMISVALTGSRAYVGVYNSLSEFDAGSVWDFVGQRAMGNNYSHSKIMYLTAAALTFNDTTQDDPALTNSCGAGRYTVCPDGTAGSLHAYWTYLTGGVLYKDWAHMEDPVVSLKAYQAAFSNLSTEPTCEDSATGTKLPCFGDGRGGESSEGSWYQYSMYRLALAMVSIQSAGYNNPIAYGPQMSLATSSWWDMKSVSDLEFLTYSFYKPQPRVGYFSTGDTLQLFRAPSDFNAQAWMMVSDSISGRTDRMADLEWPLLYTSVGGVSSFYANLANAYGWSNAIPLFLSLPAGDPVANAPADPRGQMPTDLFNGGNQHILVRSGWDPNGITSASEGDGGTNTAFSYYCANTLIDHEHETCGGFDVLSQGEFITKTRTVFNNYDMMLATAEHSNEAAYGVPAIAACAAAGSCFEWQAALGSDGKGGGQFWHGYQAGPVALAHAELPGYVAAIVDTTKLYNASSAVGWGGMSGITAASRSLIYLRGSNQVVYYDRSAGTASSRRVWMTSTGAISINGTVASWPTRSGKQAAYVTSLLPANATLSDAGAYMTSENGNPGSSDWEPYSHLLIDGGSPSATQFLTVLEWGGSSFTKSNTVLVQSTAGQNFDGALIGGTLVMFMRNWPATFSSVTYPASGAATQYVSDLTPKTTYSISGAGTPATATTDTAGVLTFSAAGTGSITVSTH